MLQDVLIWKKYILFFFNTNIIHPLIYKVYQFNIYIVYININYIYTIKM